MQSVATGKTSPSLTIIREEPAFNPKSTETAQPHTNPKPANATLGQLLFGDDEESRQARQAFKMSEQEFRQDLKNPALAAIQKEYKYSHQQQQQQQQQLNWLAQELKSTVEDIKMVATELQLPIDQLYTLVRRETAANGNDDRPSPAAVSTRTSSISSNDGSSFTTRTASISSNSSSESKQNQNHTALVFSPTTTAGTSPQQVYSSNYLAETSV